MSPEFLTDSLMSHRLVFYVVDSHISKKNKFYFFVCEKVLKYLVVGALFYTPRMKRTRGPRTKLV